MPSSTHRSAWTRARRYASSRPGAPAARYRSTDSRARGSPSGRGVGERAPGGVPVRGRQAVGEPAADLEACASSRSRPPPRSRPRSTSRSAAKSNTPWANTAGQVVLDAVHRRGPSGTAARPTPGTPPPRARGRSSRGRTAGPPPRGRPSTSAAPAPPGTRTAGGPGRAAPGRPGSTPRSGAGPRTGTRRRSGPGPGPAPASRAISAGQAVEEPADQLALGGRVGRVVGPAPRGRLELDHLAAGGQRAVVVHRLAEPVLPGLEPLPHGRVGAAVGERRCRAGRGRGRRGRPVPRPGSRCSRNRPPGTRAGAGRRSPRAAAGGRRRCSGSAPRRNRRRGRVPGRAGSVCSRARARRRSTSRLSTNPGSRARASTFGSNSGGLASRSRVSSPAARSSRAVTGSIPISSTRRRRAPSARQCGA